MPKATAVAEVPGQMALFEELASSTTEVAQYLEGGRLEQLDKDSLIGQPFVIVEASFRDGDKARYAFLHVVCRDGREGYFTDGGVGIMPVVERWLADGASRHLLCSKGLRRSDYEANALRPAGTTYYFG